MSGVRGRLFAQFVQCGFESGSQFLGRAGSPVMKEVYCRLAADHVVMNGDDVQAVRTQRFQHRRDFVRQHCTSPAISAFASLP